MKQTIMGYGVIFIMLMTVLITLSIHIHILHNDEIEMIVSYVVRECKKETFDTPEDLYSFVEETVLECNALYNSNVEIARVERIGDVWNVSFYLEYKNFDKLCILKVDRLFHII